MNARVGIYLALGLVLGLVSFAVVAGFGGDAAEAPAKLETAATTAGVRAHGHHPAPRPGITGETVVDPARYDGYPRIAATYAKAREIPEVLDGLYCHCDCAHHSGHRSLLSCFESDHGAGCDVCLSEAELAYTMTWRGRPIDAIRAQIDAGFGR